MGRSVERGVVVVRYGARQRERNSTTGLLTRRVVLRHLLPSNRMTVPTPVLLLIPAHSERVAPAPTTLTPAPRVQLSKLAELNRSRLERVLSGVGLRAMVVVRRRTSTELRRGTGTVGLIVDHSLRSVNRIEVWRRGHKVGCDHSTRVCGRRFSLRGTGGT